MFKYPLSEKEKATLREGELWEAIQLYSVIMWAGVKNEEAGHDYALERLNEASECISCRFEDQDG